MARERLAPPVDPSAAPTLLDVRDLTVSFHRGRRPVHAVDRISYTLEAGRTLAIVGESGSGKTVSSRALMGLLPPSAQVSGSVRIGGRELLGLPERSLREVRGAELAMIFQQPTRSLNPTMKVGAQIAEAIRLHSDVGADEARDRAIELLQTVRIPAAAQRVDEYPHQLSGGMRQRVMIAIAIASRPKVLIADEATTALDVTTQAQIMRLLVSLQAEFGMAVILITHDMALAASYAHEVAVMYAGRIIERATAAELFANVRVPYTCSLLDAVPDLDREAHAALPVVPGQPPDLAALPAGCAFAPRCANVQEDCRATRPALIEHVSGHAWACFHPVEGRTS